MMVLLSPNDEANKVSSSLFSVDEEAMESVVSRMSRKLPLSALQFITKSNKAEIKGPSIDLDALLCRQHDSCVRLMGSFLLVSI